MEHLRLPVAAELSLGPRYQCKKCGAKLRTEKSDRTKMKKPIFQDHIASDDCTFCGTHKNCGHYFVAVKKLFYKNNEFGYLTDKGSVVLLNTCGDYSWVCKQCWEIIASAFEMENEKNKKSQWHFRR